MPIKIAFLSLIIFTGHAKSSILKVATVKDSQHDIPVYHKSSLLERVVWLTYLQKKHWECKHSTFSSHYPVYLLINSTRNWRDSLNEQPKQMRRERVENPQEILAWDVINSKISPVLREK